MTTLLENVAAQVCQGVALTDEVIYQDVSFSPFHFTAEQCLAGKPSISIRSGMRDDIALPCINGMIAPGIFADGSRQRGRDSVKVFFVCMNRCQSGFGAVGILLDELLYSSDI